VFVLLGDGETLSFDVDEYTDVDSGDGKKYRSSSM
jgi:hypothetical protein